MTTVTSLNLKGNPVAEEKGDDFKKEVLIQLIEMKQLKIVNKEEVKQEDWTEAATEREERIKQEEEDAKNKKEGEGEGEGEEDA